MRTNKYIFKYTTSFSRNIVISNAEITLDNKTTAGAILEDFCGFVKTEVKNQQGVDVENHDINFHMISLVDSFDTEKP